MAPTPIACARHCSGSRSRSDAARSRRRDEAARFLSRDTADARPGHRAPRIETFEGARTVPAAQCVGATIIAARPRIDARPQPGGACRRSTPSPSLGSLDDAARRWWSPARGSAAPTRRGQEYLPTLETIIDRRTVRNVAVYVRSTRGTGLAIRRGTRCGGWQRKRGAHAIPADAESGLRRAAAARAVLPALVPVGAPRRRQISRAELRVKRPGRARPRAKGYCAAVRHGRWTRRCVRRCWRRAGSRSASFPPNRPLASARSSGPGSAFRAATTAPHG